MSRIRVIAIDDHHLVVQGIKDILEGQSDMTVVATGTRGEDFQTLVKKHRPHIVLLDLGMKDFDPVQAVRQHVQNHPETKIIVVTGYDNPAYMAELVQAGAAGYVLKGERITLDLPRVIRDVMDGFRVHSPAVTTQLTEFMLGDHPENFGLTDRELEITRGIAMGLTNRAIARSLGISEKRVSNVLPAIYAKMGVNEEAAHNPRVSLALKAKKIGLVPD